MKISFHSYANKTNFHMKSCAPSLAFITKFTATRKWPIERFHSRGQQPCKFIGTVLEKFLDKKRVQLPQDWFGTPIWPPFHCFGTPIERFHSRGQQPCKFIGTKESFYIRKEFSSHRIGLGHQHGRRFIVLGHQHGCRDVM